MAEDYGKRPLWQWIAIYLVIGAIVYGLIYYFVLGNKDSSSTESNPSTPQNNSVGY